jgi:hypothetical protein
MILAFIMLISCAIVMIFFSLSETPKTSFDNEESTISRIIKRTNGYVLTKDAFIKELQEERKKR